MADRSPLDQKPKLSELQMLQCLVPLAHTKWYKIGVGLKLADEDDAEYLDRLDENNEEDDEEKLFSVLKKWLREAKSSSHVLPATWRNLMSVLEKQKLDVQNLKDNLIFDFQGVSLHPATPPAGAAVSGMTPPTRPGAAVSGATPPTRPGAGISSVTPPTRPGAAVSSVTPPLSFPLSNLSGPRKVTPTKPALPDQPVLFNIESIDNNLPESAIPTIDFSLKMRDGHEVRRYQSELAEPGINGENYIIIAPTGSGKTLVAALVISNHLQENQQHLSCHVVFVVSTKPLAEQQMKQLDSFIPGAQVEVYTGDNPGTVADSIKQGHHISVCTAGKLLDEIRKGHVTFDQLSLMIFDECHHARKGHPYAKLMEYYLEYREKKSLQNLGLQIIGMTASPGAGENSDLDKKKTIDHLMGLTAVLDAWGGFKTVTENVAELQKATKSSSCTRKILKPRTTSNDPFINYISKEMLVLEASVPKMKNSFERWSQEYETRVQQVKQPLELVHDKSARDDISTLNLLRCYSNALRVYMDLRQQDAIEEMECYAGFPEDDNKATPREFDIKTRMKFLLENLKHLTPKPNPLLENMMETLRDTFQAEPTSRAILFIRTKKHAYSMRDWVREHPQLRALIRPDLITGHTRETGPGMTQVEQEEVMDRFRKGDTNLLIATSVAEEGLDVPECNLVIRFQHVSSEIAQVQTEGRARAENSQGVTILSSDSKKKFRELKNKELNILVEEIFEDKHFPVAQHLKKELEKIQHNIISQRRMKAAMKAKRQQSYSGDTVKLFCKTCKELACLGSDVHVIGSEGAHHYVVPDQEFQEKYFCKEYPSRNPRDLILNEVKRTHKIFCTKCERDWGVKCIWPTNGRKFPVIKCAAFIFEIKGVTQSLKKWSDAPFEMNPLAEWLANNSMEDSYCSSSSDTELDEY